MLETILFILASIIFFVNILGALYLKYFVFDKQLKSYKALQIKSKYELITKSLIIVFCSLHLFTFFITPISSRDAFPFDLIFMSLLFISSIFVKNTYTFTGALKRIVYNKKGFCFPLPRKMYTYPIIDWHSIESIEYLKIVSNKNNVNIKINATDSYKILFNKELADKFIDLVKHHRSDLEIINK